MLTAYVFTDLSGFCSRVHESQVHGSAWLCVHGFMLVGVYPDLGCTWYAHARQESMCPCSRDVGVVPGQELQEHRARMQAAGACAGHLCAQLRVLAAGGPDALGAARSHPSASLCSSAAGSRVGSWLRGLGPAVIGGPASGSAPSREGGAVWAPVTGEGG